VVGIGSEPRPLVRSGKLQKHWNCNPSRLIPLSNLPPLAAPVRLRNKMGELLSAVVADDKAGVQFLNRPRRPI
jgi:hypothetical protein